MKCRNNILTIVQQCTYCNVGLMKCWNNILTIVQQCTYCNVGLMKCRNNIDGFQKLCDILKNDQNRDIIIYLQKHDRVS